MGLIFTRELKSHFTNLFGSIFMAVSVAVVGIFAYLYNFLQKIPQFEYGIIAISMATVITIPFLCMFSFCQERRSGRDKFLLSLPLKPLGIVMGKYFAALFVFAIPCVVMLIIPAVLSMFGEVSLASSYASILAYFLMGAVLIAMCMLLNSLAKTAIGSLLMGIFASAILFASATMLSILPNLKMTLWLQNRFPKIYMSVTIAFTVIALIGIIVGIIAWKVSKKIYVGGIALGAVIIPSAITLAVTKKAFVMVMYKFFVFVSPYERLKIFAQGVVDLSDIIYLLSLTAILLFLLYNRFCRVSFGDAKITKADSEVARKMHRSRVQKGLVACAILLVSVTAINTAAHLIPAGYLTFDASGNGLYSISDDSKKFAKSVDEAVTVYFLCESGVSDPAIESVLKEYNVANSKIKYEIVNVSTHPEFTEKYMGIAYNKTNDAGQRPVNNYSVIVESAKRHTVVDALSFYHYRIGNYSYSESEFVSYVEYYANMGYDVSQIQYSKFFDADKVMASAIEYVVLDEVDTVYTLVGHGERPISAEFYNNLKYSNIIHDEINLSDHDRIPDICSTLIICAPKQDLSDSDAAKIIEYLDRGGDVMLITAPENALFQNLLKVTQAYGMTATNGIIHDTHRDHYQDNGEQYDLILKTNTGHDLVAFVEDAYYGQNISTKPRFPNAHPIIKYTNIPKEVTLTELFATSDQAALVINDEASTDNNRTFFPGWLAEKTIESSGEVANLFWFSSYEAFTDAYLKSRPINIYYLLATLSYAGGADEFQTSLTIDSIDVTGQFLSFGEDDASNTTQKMAPVPRMWSIVLVAVIPLAILAAGISSFVLRRTRKAKKI